MRSFKYLIRQIASSVFRIQCLVFVVIFSISTHIYGSTVSEGELKDIANDASLQMEGVDLGGGIVGRRIIAVGRNLMFQYDVPEDWQLYEYAKEYLISTLKESGQGDFYFKESITLTYFYLKINSLPITIIINPHELSSVGLELGEYISIKDHKKSKDINLRIRPPKDWVVKEGSGPNVVKKFVKEGLSFTIITKENLTFMTRHEYRAIYSDEKELRDFAKSVGSGCSEYEVKSSVLVTVGLYPAVNVESSCIKETMGKKIKIISIGWTIFYEDKIVMLAGNGFNMAEFEDLKKLYLLVAASIVFPEQFN